MKIGILLSGRGSNFKAIKAAIDKGELKNTEIALVVSNKSDSAGLAYARESGLKTLYLNHKDFDGREAYDREIVENLRAEGVGLVCLAGFMRLISPYFVQEYRNRIINIHPSLLPAFPGLDAQKQAFDYGVKFAGCTVHFVDEKMDTGPIILQKCVPVLEGDTEEALSARILEQEHKAYPEAVKLFAEGRLKVEGRKVGIL